MYSLLSRQGIVRILLVFVLPGFLSACGGTASPLKVAAHPWPGYELMFLAQDEGWLSPQKVELVSSRSATDSLRMLEEKEVDAAALTLDEVLRVRSDGTRLTIVLVIDESAGADALYVRPGIMQLADLKAKRIGVEETAVGGIMLARVLENAGLPESAVETVAVPINRQLAAWQRGQLDAVITYEPVATQLDKLGAKRLFDTRSAPDLIFDVLAVRSEVLETHANEVRHLLAAHFRALDHLKSKPQDAAFRMAGGLGLTGQEVLDSLRHLELVDVHDAQRYLAGDDGRIVKVVPQLVSILMDKGYLDMVDDLGDLVSDKYLPR